MAIFDTAGLGNICDYFASHPWVVLGLLALHVVVYLVSIVFFGGKTKGRNPFEKDCRRPHEGYVHGTKERDAVLKQRFKSSRVPQDLDVIIVGSGIGGLSAGVLLTRAGKKVLVLEQHDQAGGCCHSFVEKGFEFDTGIHYIGNLQEGSQERVLLDFLTCGQLQWAKMDDAFDTVALGDPSSAKRYPMKSGKDRFIQNLIDLFPGEKEAIMKFMDLTFDAADSFFGVLMLKVLPRKLVRLFVATGIYKIAFKAFRKGYTSRTLQSVVDELTDNKDLKSVLSYACGDYGVLPNEAPFIMHSILVRHYMNGAYYPVAGTSEIPFHMSQVITNGGGRVLVQASVSDILCDQQRRAIGVTVKGNKEEMNIFAPHIVSNAGVVNTFKTLLPPQVAQQSAIYPLIDKVGPSCSFITTFVGVDGDQEELKLPAGNVWAFNSNDINKSMGDYLKLPADEIYDKTVPLSYISFPTAKDPEYNVKFPGKSSVLIITLANWEWFKEWKTDRLRHRGDRYEAIKDMIGRDMWKSCVELFPQLDGRMVYMEVGTPVTNAHYLAAPSGEMYGLHQGLGRFTIDAITNLRPETDVPGLYLTGQDVMTCGFLPSMIMGVLASSKILNRNVYFDLMAFRKKTKPSTK